MASLAPLSANRLLHRNFVYQGQAIGGVEMPPALLVASQVPRLGRLLAKIPWQSQYS
jgi:hypothetical protein